MRDFLHQLLGYLDHYSSQMPLFRLASKPIDQALSKRVF